jgi:hypothetical protein
VIGDKVEIGAVAETRIMNELTLIVIMLAAPASLFIACSLLDAETYTQACKVLALRSRP